MNNLDQTPVGLYVCRAPYFVAPHDPLALGIAAAMLAAVAVLAAWIPARHAARIDPAITLRTE